MKSHHKRIRMVRRLALAGCVTAFAVPASASAMLPDRGPDRNQSAQQEQQYTLPSSWHSEVQTVAPKGAPVNSFALHKGFRPEVQTQSPASATAPTPSVIRQIETVTDDSGRTLAIVLASLALAIAIGTLAYAAVRMTQLQRRQVQAR